MSEKTESETIVFHIVQFSHMVDFALKNNIRNFGYGDVPGGGHSEIGTKIVESLCTTYGEKHIDYTSEHIFYKV